MIHAEGYLTQDDQKEVPYLQKVDTRRRSDRPSVGDEFVCKTCIYLPFKHDIYST